MELLADLGNSVTNGAGHYWKTSDPAEDPQVSPNPMSHSQDRPPKNVVEKVVLTSNELIPIDLGRKCHLNGNISSSISVKSAVQLYSNSFVNHLRIEKAENCNLCLLE